MFLFADINRGLLAWVPHFKWQSASSDNVTMEKIKSFPGLVCQSPIPNGLVVKSKGDSDGTFHFELIHILHH